jgi:hypothetical protein
MAINLHQVLLATNGLERVATKPRRGDLSKALNSAKRLDLEKGKLALTG